MKNSAKALLPEKKKSQMKIQKEERRERREKRERGEKRDEEERVSAVWREYECEYVEYECEYEKRVV